MASGPPRAPAATAALLLVLVLGLSPLLLALFL